MIEFVGDLSQQDALVLEEFARTSKNILEFGVGGSTQIFAQCEPKTLTCIETDPKWIELVRNKVLTFKQATYPNFYPYTTDFNNSFDLIFVDGVDNLRLDFARKTWKNLTVGGAMLFHDTRRLTDFANVLNTITQFTLEVEMALFNYKDSNISILIKKTAQPYVNWHHVEGKPEAAYSLCP